MTGKRKVARILVPKLVSDKAAIAFSTAFYLALASARSLKNAFDQGINELMLWGIPDESSSTSFSG